MMKKMAIVVVISLTIVKCFGQTTFSPGGVRYPIIWYATDSITKHSFRSVIKTPDSLISLQNASENVLMNFHPALVFDGSTSISIKLKDSSLTNTTFFATYQNKAPNVEGVVWNITKQNKTSLVSTTSRMADLESFHYMNYRDFYISNPKISTYSQQKLKDTIFPVKQFWNIGAKPTAPRLPVFSFNGLIPEVIAYNRVLTSQERLKVGSYLALKYGITLSDPGATYLNSRGDILWDGLSYSTYYHNIAGITRDDSSHLTQIKATSSNMPGLLTIAVKEQINNYTSLIWGDNDKALTAGDKIPGVPDFLKKKWLMTIRNNGLALPTSISFDTRKIDVSLPAKPVYWLAIDRTGKGDFSQASVDFIKMDSLGIDGLAHFDVTWGMKNQNEIMGFAVAQDLLAVTTITNPTCSNPNDGGLEIKIIGGVAPFNLTVKKTTSEIVLQKTLSQNDKEIIKGLSPAKYSVTVIDASGEIYTDTFYINSTDSQQPLSVASQYTLPRSGAIDIRADSGMTPGLSYEWNGPKGFHSISADVKITIPGTYELTCGFEGCDFRQDIVVYQYPLESLTDENVNIYPNPSTGHYSASVAMTNPAAVRLTSYTLDGRPMGSTQQGTGKANYKFEGDMAMTGVYLLEFKSGQSVITKKLIVVK